MDSLYSCDWTALDPLVSALQFSAASVSTLLADGATGEMVEQGVSWRQITTLAIAVGVMIGPFILGGFVAKALKMPNYSTRIGCLLLALISSVVILINKLPGLGVDLRGGTILVYEIDPGKNRVVEGEERPKIVSKDLIEPLSRRINPSGTQEIVIRPYGDTQIEIIIPDTQDTAVRRIKSRIEEAGILRFAILANRADHQRTIDLAADQAESDSQSVRTSDVVLDVNQEVIGRWARVDREDESKAVNGIRPLRMNVGDAIARNPITGQFLDIPFDVRGENGELMTARWLQEQGINDLEVLMIVDPDLDIKGEDLAFAASTFDQNGSPAVAFNLTDSGSGRFFALTTNNSPVGNRQRQLGIILDDDLLSAPNILQPIRTEGRITGNFTREEVDGLVAILKAGQLPAALTKQPIAENQIAATLGADTITKGVYSVVGSLLLILVFILFYYRFAGFVACTALLMNLAMTLATMVLINQPLTLPGLAGLVLTVGMSVDANVLIYERLREELTKGAAPRMAIRNGFARATTTIVDSNLTTLITAIVLYAIGTDQIRGFAVTLILGIVYSMFTAIYMSRTIFDVAERHGFLSLSMSDMVNSIRRGLTASGQIDFMGKGKLAMTVSGLLMVIGIVSLVARGSSILDIDFAGGSSVQFRIDKPTPADEIRRIVKSSLNVGSSEQAQYTVTAVSIADSPSNTVYKVDSSVAEVDDLKDMLSKGFASESSVGLVTYEVKVKTEGGATDLPKSPGNILGDFNGVMLTAARAQEGPAEATSTAEAPAADAPAADAPSSGAPTAGTPAVTETPAATDASATETPATDAPVANINGSLSAPEKEVSSRRVIELSIEGQSSAAAMNGPTLIEQLVKAANAVSVPLNERVVDLMPSGTGAEVWEVGSSLPFSVWTIQLPVAAEQADLVINKFKETLGSDPVWISSSSVGGQVAGDMVGRAFGALFASLVSIVCYIWFRFQRVFYGIAAVAALVHDVVITLGAIAISYWVADALGFLLIDPFKISLTVVAAILTLIGYSLNDTIVIFDRIRETKGKAVRLTSDMINNSVNQTLSRTVLTSLTTLLVVVVLYAFGGEGIHAFAFSLVVGVVVGTYSSVFIASPILLWLLDREERAKAA